MFTLKLAGYSKDEKIKLAEFLDNAKCEVFPEEYVAFFYKDGVKFCYKCEYRHFCKDIVTTLDFIEEKLYK